MASKCVVIFDDVYDYAQYALADGMPFWRAVGYFSPTDHVLYAYNAFGKRIEEIVFEAMIGKTGRNLNEIVDTLKKQTDERLEQKLLSRSKCVQNRIIPEIKSLLDVRISHNLHEGAEFNFSVKAKLMRTNST